MIHTNRIVTVGEQECIIDRPIVLYRGDREVEIEFTLVGNEFMFSEEGNVIKSVNASHGQLVLNTPSGEHMFSELAECHEGKVVFVVTKEMIDEFIEMGFYSFQIRLYDSAEMKSRVTIPPVMNGFDIRNPIAAEDETNVVDQGIVDYARIFKDQSNEELPTFDWQGNYNKTEWVHHDVITENKMNKIEDALYSINANIKESDVVMLNALDNVKKDADKYVKEHMAEVEADVEEFERNLNTDVQQFKIDTNAAMTAHKNEVSEVVDGFSGEIESINMQLAHIKNNIEVDVRDFGAIGDGVVDDTKAIQDAIDYVYENYNKSVINAGWNQCGGIVNLKSGTFRCSDTIYLKEGITLKGSTVDSCKIISTSKVKYGITNKNTGGNSGYRNVGVKNLSLVNNCIYLITGYNSKIENVSVYNSLTFGVLLQLTVFTILKNVRVHNAITGIEINGNAGEGNCTTCFCDNIWIAHCETGIVINGSNNSINTTYFRNLIVEYCANAGSVSSGTKKNANISIENAHFEENERYLTINNSDIIMKNIRFTNEDAYNIVITSPTKDYETVCIFEDIEGTIVVQNNDKTKVYYRNVYNLEKNNTTKFYKLYTYDKETIYTSTSGTGIIASAYKYFNDKSINTSDTCVFEVFIKCDEGYWHGKYILSYGKSFNIFEYSKKNIENIISNSQGTIRVDNSENFNNIEFNIKQIF